MFYFALYSSADGKTPATAATPTVATYRDRDDAARTPPSIVNRGGGIYQVVPSIADEMIGVGFEIDCGAGVTPARVSGTVGSSTLFWAVYNAAGAPAAYVGTPAITTYLHPTGSKPPPQVKNLAGGLRCFTPSTEDLAVGAVFELDNQIGATVYPARLYGNVSDGIAQTLNVPPSNTLPAESGAALPDRRDFAVDFKTGKFIWSGSQLTFTSGVAAVAQAVQIALSIQLGEFFADTSAGVPWFGGILGKTANLNAIRQILRAKILAVPGVLAVNKLDLNFNKSARSLSITWAASTDLGEISGAVTRG
jgi:hypothetical protein